MHHIITNATRVTVWSRGHQRLPGVVTGSSNDFWCGHRVIERFLVWSQGHEHFSALLHGVTEQCCAEQSQRTLHIHPMVPQVHAYIMAYGSTPYVGMTPKKNGGHIKSD